MTYQRDKKRSKGQARCQNADPNLDVRVVPRASNSHNALKLAGSVELMTEMAAAALATIPLISAESGVRCCAKWSLPGPIAARPGSGRAQSHVPSGAQRAARCSASPDVAPAPRRVTFLVLQVSTG
jgi:hypothetical protein